MKAILVSQHGGPEVLQLKEITTPEPDANQVLIKLMATGVNFVDIYQRRSPQWSTLPFIPGREGAGVVEKVGPLVTNFKPGDKVAFAGEPGTYAEFCIANVDRLIAVPDNLSFVEAAAFPLQGMTAHYLLHDFVDIVPNMVVLIHAAAGGMGLLLVQWAKRLGAFVIGTVSSEKKSILAKEAGADEVINYRERNFEQETLRITQGHGADLIIDGVGKSTFTKDLDAIAVRGHIIVYGAASGPADAIHPNALQPKSISVSGGSLGNFIASKSEMEARARSVLAGVEQGWLKLRIDHTLPLAEANKAHQLLEGRSSSGKIVLTMTSALVL